MKQFSQEFAKKLKETESVYIFVHTAPDFDCVSSAVAMSYAFYQRGVPSVILTDNFKRVKKLYEKSISLIDDEKQKYELIDPVAEEHKVDFTKFQVLVSQVIRNFYFLKKNPIILFCDCKASRAGKFVDQLPYSMISDYFSPDRTLVIDHHDPEGNEGDLLLIDDEMSSASEMCAYVLENILDVQIDKFLANIIFSGIAFDTSMFKFSSDKNAADTFMLCSRLIKFGISPNLVNEVQNDGNSINYNLYLSELLKNVQYDRKNKIALILDDKSLEMKYGGAKPSNDLFDILRSTINVDVVIFVKYTRELNIISGSVRVCAFSTFDANELCKNFEGGGGHAKAAGFRVEDSFDNVVEKIKKLTGFSTQNQYGN